MEKSKFHAFFLEYLTKSAKKVENHFEKSQGCVKIVANILCTELRRVMACLVIKKHLQRQRQIPELRGIRFNSIRSSIQKLEL